AGVCRDGTDAADGQWEDRSAGLAETRARYLEERPSGAGECGGRKSMADLVGGAGGGGGWSRRQLLLIGRRFDSKHRSDCESPPGGVAADAARVLRATDDCGSGGDRESQEPGRRREGRAERRSAADADPESLLHMALG